MHKINSTPCALHIIKPIFAGILPGRNKKTIIIALLLIQHSIFRAKIQTLPSKYQHINIINASLGNPMSHCTFLDGGYHGEKLHDTEYQSCHESAYHDNQCPENDCGKTAFPFEESLIRMIELTGQLLTEQGYHVCYTRCGNGMMTPSKVAELANSGLCQGKTMIPLQDSCLLSFHRSLLLCPGSVQNVEVFVYKRNSPSSRLAYSVLDELEKAGYRSLGIQERPNLTILRRTNMPALFITLGNLPLSADTPEENERLIQATAKAFAQGVINHFSTLPCLT